jgi:hypothetical protein
MVYIFTCFPYELHDQLTIFVTSQISLLNSNMKLAQINDVSCLYLISEIASKKIKAISVTGLGGLYGCEMLRNPDCLDNRYTECGTLLPRHIIFLFLVLISVRG